jgi:hypothetical protein
LKGKRAGGLESLLEKNQGFWAAKCGEWKTKRAIPPRGLIASNHGWLVVEIKLTSLWLGGMYFVHNQLVIL